MFLDLSASSNKADLVDLSADCSTWNTVVGVNFRAGYLSMTTLAQSKHRIVHSKQGYSTNFAFEHRRMTSFDEHDWMTNFVPRGTRLTD